mgnify:FL=1
MNREETRAFIAKRAARELHNGDVVNLGIGVPSLVSAYLPDDVRVTLHAEDGIVDEGPWPDPSNTEPGYIIDASGRPTSALPGGSYIDSSLSFALMRGGHIDCTVLGALQVDAEGNIANWIIPGKLVPGMGGAMDLVIGAKRVIVAMEHTVKGEPKIMKRCTLPLTAVGCVNLIITNMCVLEVTPEGLLMTEINPEYTVAEVQAATEAELIVSPNLKSMAS